MGTGDEGEPLLNSRPSISKKEELVVLFSLTTNSLYEEYILFYLKPEEEELIRYSLKVFREFTASFLFAGFNLATVGYFTAVVQSGKAFFISICRSLAMLCLSLLVLILILGGAGVFWAPLLSEMICMLFSVFLMKKKAGRLYDSTQD